MSYKPPFIITDEIIELISNIANALGKIEHLQHNLQASKLRKISQIKTITGTLQIEGNTLNEQQITAILEGKLVLGTVQEITEAQGAIKVYQRVTEFDYQNIDHLLEAHGLLMGELLTNAGHFRNSSVGVYGAKGVTHIAPPAHRVSGLMADLFQWLKTTNTHPLIASGVFHYEFEFIHPFVDGNGRMGRLWQYLILYRWNPIFSFIPVENIIKAEQQDYYRALQVAGAAGESTAFIQFMLKVILQTIQNNATLNAPVNGQSMKTPDTIIQLIKQNPNITKKEIAEQINKDIRTIGRAIKKLQDNNILRRVGSAKTGYWELLIK